MAVKIVINNLQEISSDEVTVEVRDFLRIPIGFAY